MIEARLIETGVVTENSNQARDLFNKNRFGTLKRDAVTLSFFEALYLIEKGKISVKSLNENSFIKKAKKKVKQFTIKYAVFKDLRDKGYVIKTALKFGAEFRVYDKGVNPGQDHSKWVVYPVHESENLTWHEFAAKNRVAHSTKKNLLIGIVDDEDDVTYYEVAWKRP